MSRREDPEFRLVRKPDLDSGDAACWEIQKRRVIFGYRHAHMFYVHRELRESDLVEYALSIVNPKTIAL